MIKLNVEDYCQDCGHFEPECNSCEFFHFDEPPTYDTYITCSRSHDCERIYKHLKKEAKKSEL